MLDGVLDGVPTTFTTTEAKPLMRRAFAIVSQSLGDDHQSIRTVQRNWGVLVAALAKNGPRG